MNLLPNGLRLQFNLAFKPENENLLGSLKNLLDNTSSEVFRLIQSEVQIITNVYANNFQEYLDKLRKKTGIGSANRLLGRIKRDCQSTLTDIRKQHWKKIRTLKHEKEINGVQLTKGDYQGSLKIAADELLPAAQRQVNANQKSCKTSHQNKNNGRRKNNRAKKRRQNNKSSGFYTPTEEDLHRFNPIVLAENVTLTEDQISICRMSDCFAPTPTQPIDVSDQMLGTHAWAERLRWHHFHEKQQMSKETNNKPTDKEKKDDQEIKVFKKKPWYRPTTRSAPRDDPALETFIEACTRDFLDTNKRKRIKDNLSKGQREALRELRNLPLTHQAACRFADKSAATVITPLCEDDAIINQTLKDNKQYDILKEDPTHNTRKKIQDWANKWLNKGDIDEDVYAFVCNTSNSHPARCKPLVKTHKPLPYPYRLLLSGSGTPVQPLSKFVQLSINHLTDFIPYQIMDTKEFLQKVEIINTTVAPLPPSATLAVCDVVSLYPSVDNSMGVPAVAKMLKKHPSPSNVSKECVVEGLKITLNNNVCAYTDGAGETIIASPNHGTAMGPCHACDYVDIFMGELDQKLVNESPVPLVSSLVPKQMSEIQQTKHLDWNRFRDDGFAILPDSADVEAFEHHLQNLHPPGIRWTVSHGKEVDYLDMKVKINDSGFIETDVFSKNCNSYLPPSSCHPTSVFKGLATSIGIRLRMIVSDDGKLRDRIVEYSKYLTLSGWQYKKAQSNVMKGASQTREKILQKPRKRGNKKIAWVSKYEPRAPSKSSIIKKNIHLLYSNPINKTIFPPKSIIAANRRLTNIGEIYKPTIPRRFVKHGPNECPGFFKCSRKCDACKHAQNTNELVSPWDGRRWKIYGHLTCTTPNVIYVIKCSLHPDQWYVGSTVNLKARWANHKSDVNQSKNSKCMVAHHVNTCPHPKDSEVPFLSICPIEAVKGGDGQLLRRELFWQANLGSLFMGLNRRKDFNSCVKERIQYNNT